MTAPLPMMMHAYLMAHDMMMGRGCEGGGDGQECEAGGEYGDDCFLHGLRVY